MTPELRRGLRRREVVVAVLVKYLEHGTTMVPQHEPFRRFVDGERRAAE